MEKRKHIVILAAGDFPSHPIPLAALHDADFVVCCDSAYSQFSIFNGSTGVSPASPFVVIGDGDSLPPSTRRHLGEKFIHVAEQDYNDLHKAMRWATQEFSILNSQFSILGATGKREDHTLGNIAYLVTFAEEYPGIQLEMLTDHGRLLSFRGERTFPSFPGQQVSLFVMDPATALTSSGPPSTRPSPTPSPSMPPAGPSPSSPIPRRNKKNLHLIQKFYIFAPMIPTRYMDANSCI